MSYLIFDTETTDLPKKFLKATDPKQAHICQLAALHVDDKFVEISSFSVLIKPRGWTIQSGAQAAHGITQEQCEKDGIEINEAMFMFHDAFNKTNRHVAYNAEFDRQLIDIETLVCNLNPLNWGSLICPMKPLTNICKLPNRWKNGYKWPKLQEAYQFCFKKSFDKAHDAMADVRALNQVFQWCLNNNVRL